MTAQISKEIEKRIVWLNEEIDRCLSCDLPIAHLERELALITALESSRKRRETLQRETARLSAQLKNVCTVPEGAD